jgi:hypothetical protein
VKPGRGTAVATALLLAALAAAGCGLGPGADVGSVELTVTREFGAVAVLQRSLKAKESDTVMRALEGNVDVDTRFGGGFVHSIEGVAEDERGGDPYDWFFFVDGVESPVGAADVDLEGGGERIWWDFRNWSATDHVPAVVGTWPAPFVDGVAGRHYPVVLECANQSRGSLRTDADRKEPRPARSDADRKEPRPAWSDACETAGRALEREGVELASSSPDGAIRMLVGPWDRLRGDPAARLLEAGPGESGIYANFEAGVRPSSPSGRGMTNAKMDYALSALDEDGEPAGRLGPDAGLVAATSRYGGPPVWLVTGATAAAVREAADALDAQHLRDHYAVAIEAGKATPLPVAG